uniref:Conotoxin Eb6.5 n=1 Tax=Conus eburneus TaxID=101300 RepID=F6LPL6_CONEB|nr:conotoxin Eb6.5 [Conus eburneus]UMA83509.1 conotoxin precursor O1 [Conus judaeus]
MKLTYMMIVTVLILTTWTVVMADDPKNGLEILFSKARDEMKNPEASKLNKKTCLGKNALCGAPGVGVLVCCSFKCVVVCV